jgi:hypothetical protein
MANGFAMLTLGVFFLFNSAQGWAFSEAAPVPVSPPAVPFTDAYHDGYVYVAWATYSDADLSKTIARVKQTGATHLTITSSDVGACSVGSQEQAIREAKIATAQGMGVTFLPIVTTPKWDWRGEFNPDDVDAWFVSYKAWLKGLAEIANQLQATDFVVGSELSILYDDESHWSDLLDEFHGIFNGPLIVTVNWSKLDYSFWSHADAIGISSYFPLSTSDSPTQDDLDAGMNSVKNQMLEVSHKWNRPIYITEIGFSSTKTAAKTPWLSDASDGVDQSLQAACFESIRRAWSSESSLARLSIWATGDLTSPDYSYSFETVGKLAEAPIAQFFAERSKLHP